jgi:hypothetical protein
MIAEIVYVLCGVLSALCAGMLYSKYRATQTRFLLWSSLCFVGLAINNVILFIDMIIIPQTDISVIRMIPALLGVSVLIYGFLVDAV